MSRPLPRFTHTLLAAAACAALTAPASGATYVGHERQIQLEPPRLTQAPTIDGRVDESEWANAARLDGFTQARPVEGVKDTLGTLCLVGYDSSNLYVAFRCRELPGLVQAPIVSRDNIWTGDWVGVSIDSYHDRQRSYFLCANPRGVQADGVDQEGNESDNSPDFQYTTKGRVTEEGFEVEFAIPFKSLRFAPSERVSFGFNAIRDQRRTNAHLYWAPVTRNIAGYHRQLGDLEGMSGIRPGRNLEINPYVTSSDAAERRSGAMRWADAEHRQGFGLKYGITSALTADVTVTPDFSQVEADAGVLDVNERFAIFFPEKRPFFLEGADIFSTPSSLVYTRRIVDPLYGVKLTGKAGRTAIGVLSAADRSAGESTPGLPDRVNPYFDHDAQFFVARVRRDFHDRLSLGALVTNRTHEDVYNRVAALDGRWTFRRSWTVTAQSSRSWDAAPDLRNTLAGLDSATAVNVPGHLASLSGERAGGWAHTANLRYTSRRFSWNSNFEDITTGFRTSAGFVNRPGTFEIFHNLSGRIDGRKGGRWQWIEPVVRVQQLYDHGEQGVSGKLTDFSTRPEIVVHFDGSTALGTGVNRLSSWYAGRAFEPQFRQFLWAETGRWRTLRPGFFVSNGSTVIFAEAAPGHSIAPEVWADLRLSERFDGSFSMTATRIRRDSNDSRYAEAVIPRLRLGYQFTPELSVRWITEWVDRRRYDENDAQVARDRTLGEDLLVSYLLRPGTVVYLGYGTRLTGDESGPLHASNHSLFMKASYLWQM
ncbi:MAG: carbohydrate binding family 9 domain-containing protein [Candidatus Eisenbacteria bacterium]|uniref:Carbohydrate binding family 9 domain-containing protein n=1 Tax=Eiseniibacteriota bacterium TaxID=2212470 RepID=A0A933W2V5_UNCEI|nr:carbohydrate binding family 9 domain-containing protein [Candidatus Eisenbacteria bacterium]